MTALGPITYDDVRWEPKGRRYAGGALPKYGTYHPAVPATIADLVLDLPSSVLADAETASREIARFDAELGGETAPFASNLPVALDATQSAGDRGDARRQRPKPMLTSTGTPKRSLPLVQLDTTSDQRPRQESNLRPRD